MRHVFSFTLIMLACIPDTQAASCRAAAAAQSGSESGYQRAKAAADAWSQRQNNVSASLGDCLGNISTTITAPTFPNLTDAMNQIGQKICQAARDKINHYIPPTIDPWGESPTLSRTSYLPETKPSGSLPANTSRNQRSSFISLN
jgi:TraL protein